jgi:hypothetical protein
MDAPSETGLLGLFLVYSKRDYADKGEEDD